MILITDFKDYYDWAAHVYRDDKIRYDRNATAPIPLERRDERARLLMDVVHFADHRRRGVGDERPYTFSRELYSIAGLGVAVVVVLQPKGKPKERFVLPIQSRELFDRLSQPDIQSSYLTRWRWTRNDVWSQWQTDVSDWCDAPKRIRLNPWHARFDAPVLRFAEVDMDPKRYRTAVAVEPNPCLVEAHLNQAFADIDVFQAISQWLGMRQHPESPPAGVPDKYMVEQKGFDPKYGFRKPPSA